MTTDLRTELLGKIRALQTTAHAMDGNIVLLMRLLGQITELQVLVALGSPNPKRTLPARTDHYDPLQELADAAAGGAEPPCTAARGTLLLALLKSYDSLRGALEDISSEECCCDRGGNIEWAEDATEEEMACAACRAQIELDKLVAT